MFVRDCMVRNPITITLETPISQALEIVVKRKIRHLPVLRDGKVVGLVTERGLLEVSPSPATTLSVYELNYVLAKVTVKEALVKNPVSVSSDCPIEVAAHVMREKKIGSLLVIDDGKLVGIVTQTDMVEAMVRLFGLRKAGSRIVIEAPDRVGVLAEITEIFKEKNTNIISLVCLEVDGGFMHLTIRGSLADPRPLVAEIEARGFKIVSVS